ncbi:hypothetical protein [Mesorhizobium huakuii]|uniref:hypothetical protein n=1 Tax=Mesorhizobium huakuii TaxID=28104 RepID=UPI001AEEA742|nr:hypothetical protein [Mesorhizobium huakuii]
MKDKIKLLIAQAKEAGAESISLIPSNDGAIEPDEKRLSDLRGALAVILPMLEEADLVVLLEPLGFTTSSLRRKREAVEAIEAVGGRIGSGWCTIRSTITSLARPNFSRNGQASCIFPASLIHPLHPRR